MKKSLGNGLTQRPSVEKVTVDCCYLFTEQDALVVNSACSSKDSDSCRTWSAAREDWDNDEVVRGPVPNIV